MLRLCSEALGRETGGERVHRLELLRRVLERLELTWERLGLELLLLGLELLLLGSELRLLRGELRLLEAGRLVESERVRLELLDAGRSPSGSLRASAALVLLLDALALLTETLGLGLLATELGLLAEALLLLDGRAEEFIRGGPSSAGGDDDRGGESGHGSSGPGRGRGRDEAEKLLAQVDLLVRLRDALLERRLELVRVAVEHELRGEAAETGAAIGLGRAALEDVAVVLVVEDGSLDGRSGSRALRSGLSAGQALDFSLKVDRSRDRASSDRSRQSRLRGLSRLNGAPDFGNADGGLFGGNRHLGALDSHGVLRAVDAGRNADHAGDLSLFVGLFTGNRASGALLNGLDERTRRVDGSSRPILVFVDVEAGRDVGATLRQNGAIHLFLAGGLLLLLSVAVAGVARLVGELALHAVGIDVAVLAAHDAVDAARLLLERSVGVLVAERERAILVLEAVPADGFNERFSLLLGLGRSGLLSLGNGSFSDDDSLFLRLLDDGGARASAGAGRAGLRTNSNRAYFFLDNLFGLLDDLLHLDWARTGSKSRQFSHWLGSGNLGLLGESDWLEGEDGLGGEHKGLLGRCSRCLGRSGRRDLGRGTGSGRVDARLGDEAAPLAGGGSDRFLFGFALFEQF